MIRPAQRRDRVRSILEEADGAFVAQPTLLRAVYGRSDPRAAANLRQLLYRLRHARPGVEIERVYGYRLRRAGHARDRRHAPDTIVRKL